MADQVAVDLNESVPLILKAERQRIVDILLRDLISPLCKLAQRMKNFCSTLAGALTSYDLYLIFTHNDCDAKCLFDFFRMNVKLSEHIRHKLDRDVYRYLTQVHQLLVPPYPAVSRSVDLP